MGQNQRRVKRWIPLDLNLIKLADSSWGELNKTESAGGKVL